MQQKVHILPWVAIGKVALLVCILLRLLVPMALAVTESISSDEAELVGWIEIVCDVPDDFHEPVTLVISEDETGEIYSVVCREINDYIGRAELPEGSFTIFQVIAADDRPASCDISTFEISDHMRAAVGIKVTVEDATGATLISESPVADDSDSDRDDTPVVADSPDAPDAAQESAPDDVASVDDGTTNISADDERHMNFQFLKPIGFLIVAIVVVILLKRWRNRR